MAQFIILDAGLGITPKEFAAAWNVDEEYSQDALLEERRRAQTFDASLLHLLRELGSPLTYLTVATMTTTLILNVAKIRTMLRKSFAGRVQEGIDIKIEKQGDHEVITIRETTTT